MCCRCGSEPLRQLASFQQKAVIVDGVSCGVWKATQVAT